MTAFVTVNRTVPYSIIHAPEISNIVGEYLTDNVSNVSEILKRVNAAISWRNIDERVSMLTPQEIFDGLGEDGWKEIIDGKYHHLGPMVFDQPRTGHNGEPGFYHGITTACKAASELLSEPLRITTIAAYQMIHRHACGHFRGTGMSGDQTLVDGSYAGQFLGNFGKGCSGSYGDLFMDDPTTSSGITAKPERWAALRTANRNWANITLISEVVEICKKNGIEWSYGSLSPEAQLAVREKYGCSTEGALDKNTIDKLTRSELTCMSQKAEREEEKQWNSKFGSRIREKLSRLNGEMQEGSIALGIAKSLVQIGDSRTGVRVLYQCPDHLLVSVVERIFERFRKDIEAATSKAERRRCIADLYQKLEWVHPFPDGQGRTDLIMLKTLLVAYGLTPAILHEPYVSTFCSLDVWDAYLADGMEKWKWEFASKHRA